jgi:hypothetical protein
MYVLCINMLAYNQNVNCTGCINPMPPNTAGCTQYPYLAASPVVVGKTTYGYISNEEPKG